MQLMVFVDDPDHLGLRVVDLPFSDNRRCLMGRDKNTLDQDDRLTSVLDLETDRVGTTRGSSLKNNVTLVLKLAIQLLSMM